MMFQQTCFYVEKTNCLKFVWKDKCVAATGGHFHFQNRQNSHVCDVRVWVGGIGPFMVHKLIRKWAASSSVIVIVRQFQIPCFGPFKLKCSTHKSQTMATTFWASNLCEWKLINMTGNYTFSLCVYVVDMRDKMTPCINCIKSMALLCFAIKRRKHTSANVCAFKYNIECWKRYALFQCRHYIGSIKSNKQPAGERARGSVCAMFSLTT